MTDQKTVTVSIFRPVAGGKLTRTVTIGEDVYNLDSRLRVSEALTGCSAEGLSDIFSRKSAFYRSGVGEVVIDFGSELSTIGVLNAEELCMELVVRANQVTKEFEKTYPPVSSIASSAVSVFTHPQ